MFSSADKISFKYDGYVFKEKVLDEIDDNVSNEDNLYELIETIKNTFLFPTKLIALRSLVLP